MPSCSTRTCCATGWSKMAHIEYNKNSPAPLSHTLSVHWTAAVLSGCSAFCCLPLHGDSLIAIAQCQTSSSPSYPVVPQALSESFPTWYASTTLLRHGNELCPPNPGRGSVGLSMHSIDNKPFQDCICASGEANLGSLLSVPHICQQAPDI